MVLIYRHDMCGNTWSVECVVCVRKEFSEYRIGPQHEKIFWVTKRIQHVKNAFPELHWLPVQVLALWKQNRKYPATILRVQEDGAFLVR